MMTPVKHLTAGTRVKVADPGPVPQWSAWDDDGQRTTTRAKRRLQELFFKGDRRVTGQIVYIASDSIRQQLKKTGHIKIELRDAAGCRIVITADPENLLRCA